MLFESSTRATFNFLTSGDVVPDGAFPISGFPQVIDILGHCTGSLFLDISYDCESPDHPYQWNKRDLKALARQWKRAQLMQEAMNSTTKALLDNPSAWETIFSCWSDLCTATHEAQT
jgi:hypothetical protein